MTLHKQCYCSDSLGKYIDASLECCLNMRVDSMTISEDLTEYLTCVVLAFDSLEGKFEFGDWSSSTVLTENPTGRIVWLAAVGEKMNTKLCFPKQLHLGYNLSFVSFDMIYSGDKCHYDRLEVRQTLKNDKGPLVQVYCGRRPPWSLHLQADLVCIALVSDGNKRVYIQSSYQLVRPILTTSDNHQIIEIKSNFSAKGHLFRRLVYNGQTTGDVLQYRWVFRAPWGRRLNLVAQTELDEDEHLVITEGPDYHANKEARYIDIFGDTSPLINVTSYGPVVNMKLFSNLSRNISYINISLHAVDQLVLNKVLKLHSGSSVISINYQLSCPKKFDITYCLLSIDSRPGTYPNVSITEFLYKAPDIHLCMYTIIALYSHIVSSDKVIYSFCRDDEPNT